MRSFAPILVVVALVRPSWAKEDCGELAKLNIDGARIERANVAGPDFMTPPTELAMLKPVAVKPKFCRVQGVIDPAIRFEVWLPIEGKWNGKFLGIGNGGMAGSINYASLAAAVESGFAAVSSDLGHEGSVLDGSFAIGKPDRVIDWGYRATHEMTVKGKAIAAAFYGREARYAYFTGCSGGGRQGVVEAQRFPQDYDGILAGDPTINFTRLTTGGRLWGELVMMREAGGTGFIPGSKLPAIAAAVNKACDALDGVEDGVLEDPRQCHFDPAAIQCAAEGRPDCLTAPQVTALRKVYSGAVTSAGEQIFPGYEPGGELGPGGWGFYRMPATVATDSGQWKYASGFLKGMVFENLSYDPVTFNFDTDIAPMDNKPILGETLAQVINGGNADLSAFAKAKGKIILYHGWSDPGVAARNTVNYYEAVMSRTGKAGPEATAATQKFARLFMAPGMQHCGGGPGPNAFGGFLQPAVPDDPDHNMMRALERWVEKGIAPQRIVATKYVDDVPDKGVLRTRPLCLYPQTAHYTGSGDTNAAENFACR